MAVICRLYYGRNLLLFFVILGCVFTFAESKEAPKSAPGAAAVPAPAVGDNAAVPAAKKPQPGVHVVSTFSLFSCSKVAKMLKRQRGVLNHMNESPV